MSGIDPFDVKTVGRAGGNGRSEAQSRIELAFACRDEVFDVLHLAELVPVVRATFTLDADFSDDAILASLKAIAARSNERDRWHVAFGSNLGRHIGLTASEPADGLRTLIGLLPRPLS